MAWVSSPFSHAPRFCPNIYTHQVKQSVLVKDVLRAVQGLKGSYMHYAAGPQAASPAAAGSGLLLAGYTELQLPEGQRTLIHELGELGLMFK